MNAEPISKELYNELTRLGVTKVILSFSGGSDEGFLDVTYEGMDNEYFVEDYRKINEKVEEWAWSVYSYSGAGDGSDFGDTIVYDLVNKRVSTSEWWHERVGGPEFDGDLEIEAQ